MQKNTLYTPCVIQFIAKTVLVCMTIKTTNADYFLQATLNYNCVMTKSTMNPIRWMYSD